MSGRSSRGCPGKQPVPEYQEQCAASTQKHSAGFPACDRLLDEDSREYHGHYRKCRGDDGGIHRRSHRYTCHIDTLVQDDSEQSGEEESEIIGLVRYFLPFREQGENPEQNRSPENPDISHQHGRYCIGIHCRLGYRGHQPPHHTRTQHGQMPVFLLFSHDPLIFGRQTYI